MHFICIYLLALLHIFEYTKKTELYPAIGKEELFQMLYSQNKKRGFTLVELIVVLVILAILAALLIPALTGYIDKAKKDQVIAETRMLHEAVQTEMVEIYASDVNWKPIAANGSPNQQTRSCTLASKTGQKSLLSTSILSDAKQRYQDIVTLSEVPSLQDGSGRFFAFITSEAKVHILVYDSGRGYIGVYFRDTQQYSAYKIGEQAAGGTVKVDGMSSYWDFVHYSSYFDTDTFNPGDTEASIWTCAGIRGLMNIEKNVFNW